MAITDKPYEYEVGGTYFYPDEAKGAFYGPDGDTVGALYAPMLADGTMDVDNVGEIISTWDES